MSHIGTVRAIHDGQRDVEIVQKSACSGCHLKSACTSSDQAEKIIEVPYFGNEYHVGDEVTVVGSNRMGWEAIAYAFFIPFLLMLLSLVAIIEILNDELLAGLISLGILIPYYVVLYFFRDKLKRKFVFYIK